MFSWSSSMPCDRNAAESVRGMLVGVPRAAIPAVGEDEFYWALDLAYRSLIRASRGWGCVVGLIETSANDVLRVSDGDAPERLLPICRLGCSGCRFGAAVRPR